MVPSRPVYENRAAKISRQLPANCERKLQIEAVSPLPVNDYSGPRKKASFFKPGG
jgi:hypothetical protein